MITYEYKSNLKCLLVPDSLSEMLNLIKTEFELESLFQCNDYRIWYQNLNDISNSLVLINQQNYDDFQEKVSRNLVNKVCINKETIIGVGDDNKLNDNSRTITESSAEETKPSVPSFNENSLRTLITERLNSNGKKTNKKNLLISDFQNNSNPVNLKMEKLLFKANCKVRRQLKLEKSNLSYTMKYLGENNVKLIVRKRDKMSFKQVKEFEINMDHFQSTNQKNTINIFQKLIIWSIYNIKSIETKVDLSRF